MKKYARIQIYPTHGTLNMIGKDQNFLIRSASIAFFPLSRLTRIINNVLVPYDDAESALDVPALGALGGSRQPRLNALPKVRPQSSKLAARHQPEMV